MSKTVRLISVILIIASLLLLPVQNKPVLAQSVYPQSVNVAVISSLYVTNGGIFPTTTTGPTGSFTDFHFFILPAINVSLSALGPGGICGATGCDTVLLNVASSDLSCNLNTLNNQQKADLIQFVHNGYKLIIYDSECQTQDYSWLPYPFTTSNPGAMGAHGTLTIIEENTLSSNDPISPYYINAPMLGSQSDAVGDMNVMTTLDPNWSLDMSGTNILGVSGPVHTYAKYPSGTDYGLIIYNGLDVDYLYSSTIPNSSSPGGNLAKLWLPGIQTTFQSFKIAGRNTSCWDCPFSS